MNIYLENGDINTVGITLVCVAFIILVFILLSIFGKYLIKETDEEIEDYLDNEEDIKASKIPKVKVEYNKKRLNKKKNNTKKSSTIKPKYKPKRKVELQENVSKPLQEGRTKGNVKPKENDERKAPAPKPIKHTKKEVGKNDNIKEDFKKEKKPITENKSNTEAKAKVETKVKNETSESKDMDKVNNFNEHLDIKEKEEKKASVKKDNKSEKVVGKDVKSEPTNNKSITVGHVSYNESISLNEAEKKLLLSIRNPNERGHIFQFHKGQKIMDFSIKMGTQYNRIKKLIDDNKNNNGDYTVYLIWEKKLVGRYFLENKLLYNPNISYS